MNDSNPSYQNLKPNPTNTKWKWGGKRQFSIAIGKVAHEKHQLRIGDEISGAGVPVADKRLEPVILQGI